MMGIIIKICEACHVNPAAHNLHCPECEEAGRPAQHYLCNECYAEAEAEGNINHKQYKQFDMRDSLKERLK